MNKKSYLTYMDSPPREELPCAGAVLSLSCLLDTEERYRRGLTQADVDGFGDVFENPNIREFDPKELNIKLDKKRAGTFRARFI